LPQRLAVVERHFTEQGIRLQSPYLNRESEDRYGLRLGAPSRVCAPAPISPTTVLREEALNTARGIAESLCRNAIWYAERCTWLGSDLDDDRGAGSSYATLGPSLYDGLAGIALFLAEINAVHRDPDIRRTAIGAIHQALARIEDCPPPHRLGLYSGWLGIALATARVGLLLERSDLLASAARLARRCPDAGFQEFDLVAGRAGGIVALLALGQLLNDGDCIDRAIALGDALCRGAERGGHGCSWPALNRTTARNLTGYSHGTAGVAYALLTLHEATGHDKYLRMANRAFAYENGCYDSGAGNWPDFRRGSAANSCMTAWCHGAAGIALSRLYALELLGDSAYRDDSLVALQNTVEVTTRWLRAGTANFSLCHGLAGNAEILVEGDRILKNRRNRALAEEVARFGIDNYAGPDQGWPCGTRTGDTPGLMLGLAGIGYFYLRLYAPRIPSLLAIRPDAFASNG
jgi:lantibiotic modifying enzyme